MTLTRRQAIVGGVALTPVLVNGRAFALAPPEASCRRLPDGRVAIAWTDAPFDVRRSDQPDGPFDERVARGVRGAWEGTAPTSPRPYFHLSGAGGRAETAERLLPLQGGRNFRDLGGYRAADGRMVRWGRLYRSGSMSSLTEQDYGYLAQLGIAVICDFRSTEERTHEPTAWRGSPTPAMVSRDYEMNLGAFLKANGGEITAAKAKASMIGLYENLPYDQLDNYRRMFGELVEGRTPLAFNCSAGKDRTGVAAALLLTVLGVSRDQVTADYALSDKVVDYAAILKASTPEKTPAGFGGMARVAPELRTAMMRSDPAYVEAALTEIARREGSVGNYVRVRLGVSPAQLRAMRDRLLKRV